MLKITHHIAWYNRAIRVRSPTGAKDFSSSLCVQSGSGAHPASCPMGTGGPFPGGKARPGHDADHSPQSSAEVMNELQLYLLSPQKHLHGVQRDCFTLLYIAQCSSVITICKKLSNKFYNSITVNCSNTKNTFHKLKGEENKIQTTTYDWLQKQQRLSFVTNNVNHVKFSSLLHTTGT
jgi:hypothetical protein